MTIDSQSPDADVLRLAERLRELRERGLPRRLTQTELGQALQDAGGAASPATISMWENPGSSGRTVPASRIDGYARIFCTPRSLADDGVRMLEFGDLTAQEQYRFEELKQELLDLRDRAVSRQEEPAAQPAHSPQSLWSFPDESRITLVCGRLAEDDMPAHALPDSLDYVRLAELADLDTLLDIYGVVRVNNPRSRVVIMAAQDLTQRDVANHLVLIGGLAWDAVYPWFTRIFPMPVPIEPGDPAERGAMVFRDTDGREESFAYTLAGGELVEDVGFFARGPNPSAPMRTLTICSGITTRGVHGAAKCFIDKELLERNEGYLLPRLRGRATYCIAMRVPVVNGSPLTPDLSRDETRLFEWSDAATTAG